MIKPPATKPSLHADQRWKMHGPFKNPDVSGVMYGGSDSLERKDTGENTLPTYSGISLSILHCWL